jgi:hypothetical protein
MTALPAEPIVAPGSMPAFFSKFSKVSPTDRRSHATAYNYWLLIRGRRRLPSIRDFDPLELSSLSANSMLVAMLDGGKDAEIEYIGEALSSETGITPIERIASAPSPSILSCAAEHLPQVLSTGNPIAFETEFVTDSGAVTCWGTLLPLSSTGTWSDYVFGVLTFERQAHIQQTVAELEPAAGTDPKFEIKELELSAEDDVKPAAEPSEIPAPGAGYSAPEADAWQKVEFDSDFEDQWVTKPITSAPQVHSKVELGAESQPAAALQPKTTNSPPREHTSPRPGFACSVSGPIQNAKRAEATMKGATKPEYDELQLTEALVSPPVESNVLDSRLVEARNKAEVAAEASVRSHVALYSALSAAYDFALEAQSNAEAYSRIVEEAGLAVQARAPLTPVIKLVFGLDYDKARVTEFAAVLSWALRQNLPAGAFGERLESEGGLKAVVRAERSARHPESQSDSNEFAALRSAPALVSMNIPLSGADEFVLLVARRELNGEFAILKAVADPQLLRRAVRKIS